MPHTAAGKGRRVSPSGESRLGARGESERLVDVNEATELLGLKPRTLYQWAYKRRIPVVKLFGPRGALRFRLSDVEQLIKDSVRRDVKGHDERLIR